MCSDENIITVSTEVKDKNNDALTYKYDVTGGRIVGSGSQVQWDLSDIQPGTYVVTVRVRDRDRRIPAKNVRYEKITVQECPDCLRDIECPTLGVLGPNGPKSAGEEMIFTANLTGGAQVTYTWKVSSGTILSGQGTASITVDTTGLAGQTVTATVEIGGLDPEGNCITTASGSALVSSSL